MKSNSVAKYFDPPPFQWGLRGDPQLWQEMKAKMEVVNIPATAPELERLLHKQFKELTGEEAKKGTRIFIRGYDTGGMSGGIVSSSFWLDTGFPLIIQRFIEMEMR